MLTRRALLAGPAAFAMPPLGPALAAEAAVGGFRVEAASLPLAPQGPPTAALRLAGPGPEGALWIDPGRAAPVPIRNTTAAPMVLALRGWRGSGGLDDAPVAIAPGQDGSLQVPPRRGGTALLRAVPSPMRFAERGAVGVVVPDASPPSVDRDMVLMLNDWLLAADNVLRFGSTPPADAVAGVVTVNGLPRPVEAGVPPRTRLRLRLVNASVQRLMIVSCTGARPMVAAIDGQPCDLFAPTRNAVPIGPGARYDLLLDMPETADARVRFTLKPTLTVNGTLEPERDLLLLSTEGPPLPAKPPMVPLPGNPDLPSRIPLEAARRVDLTFGGQPGTASTPPAGWTVNGIPGPAADRPVLTVRRGDAVVLGLNNASATLLPLRIAGHAVRLLHARDDGWEPYWRDTLLLPPNGRAHVAFVADATGRWPIDSGYDELTLAGSACCFTVTAR